MKKRCSAAALTLILSSMCHGEGGTFPSFEQLDRNGDGQLSREEYSQSIPRTGSRSPGAADSKISDSKAPKPTAADGALAESKEESVYEKVSQYVHVRKSYLTPGDDAKPARFSWSKASDAEFYAVDGAIQLRPFYGSNEHFDWELLPTFEAHVTDEVGKFQDSMSVRLPLEMVFSSGNRLDVAEDGSVTYNTEGDGIYLFASPVWETDRIQSVENVGADLNVTANHQDLPFVGKRTKVGGSDSSLAVRFRPWIGVEGGEYLDTGGAAEILGVNDYFRIAPRAHLDFWLSDQFILSGEYIYRTDLINDDDFGFVEASATYYFDPEQHFAIGLTYKYGQTTPQFSDVDSLSAWLGIKF